MDDIRHKLVTKPTRFLDKLRLHIRQQGLAYTTEKTYIHWVKRFIYCSQQETPRQFGYRRCGSISIPLSCVIPPISHRSNK